MPLLQSGTWPFALAVVRTTATDATVAAQLRREITAQAPGVRVTALLGMETAIDQQLVRERLAAGLAVLFSALALTLAAVGLYGMVSYSVTRRTSEIGVRMAMGADAGNIIRLVLRGSLAMVLLGLGLGVPLALVAGRSLGALLYGVGASDPLLLAGAAFTLVTLVTVGVASSFAPAVRAAHIDPMVALRSE